MLKKLFLLIGIVFLLSFVSAGRILIPSSITPGQTVTITIEDESYYKYIHFYSLTNSGWNYLMAISLNCSSTCEGKKSFDFSFSGFPEGDYMIYVYSYTSASWLFQTFEISSEFSSVKCSDGTADTQCSSITKPKYCTNGTLIDKCSACGCPAENPVCSASGKCASNLQIGVNKKSSSFYSDKMVFLMSDKNWREMLPLVSVTTWTEGSNVKKYPSLIYHESSVDNVDIDSIVLFLQHYSPNKLIIFGQSSSAMDGVFLSEPPFGAGLSSENILKINPIEYLGFWETFDTLVYVKDNYELALLASTYASLLNAPLVIQGTTADSSSIFAGRKVICVGEITPSGGSCAEKYNLDSLRQKYKSMTNTNKVILVNPNDWGGTNSYYFYPKKTSSSFKDIYTKTSLVSPILASAKHELILSTNETDSAKIDTFLNNRLSNINYLTIVASNQAISSRAYKETYIGYDFYWALDPSLYADTNGDRKPELAVGRIAGITLSDASTNIAQSLFYNEFTKSNNMKFMGSSNQGYYAGLVREIANKFSYSGYNAKTVTSDEEAYDFEPSEWKNQDLIYYLDHGNSYWSGIYSWEIPLLNNSLVISDSCSTASTFDTDSFWAKSIRQGAIGYIGAVGVSLSTLYGTENRNIDFLNYVYYYKDDLGQAFKKSYDTDKYMAMNIFFGDPTLNLQPSIFLKTTLLSFCLGENSGCFINSQCCSDLECSWFKCQNCKSEDKFCWTNGDCCLGLQCSWFTCKDCKNSGQFCWTNGDCCPGLRCGWFTCKDCKSSGSFCMSNKACCSNRCSWFKCK